MAPKRAHAKSNEFIDDDDASSEAQSSGSESKPKVSSTGAEPVGAEVVYYSEELDRMTCTDCSVSVLLIRKQRKQLPRRKSSRNLPSRRNPKRRSPMTKPSTMMILTATTTKKEQSWWRRTRRGINILKCRGIRESRWGSTRGLFWLILGRWVEGIFKSCWRLVLWGEAVRGLHSYSLVCFWGATGILDLFERWSGWLTRQERYFIEQGAMGWCSRWSGCCESLLSFSSHAHCWNSRGLRSDQCGYRSFVKFFFSVVYFIYLFVCWMWRFFSLSWNRFPEFAIILILENSSAALRNAECQERKNNSPLTCLKKELGLRMV